MRTFKFFVVLIFIGAVVFNTSQDKNSNIEQRVEAIMELMSLEEKVAQMIQAEIKFVTPKDLKKYKLGSILNGGGSYPNNDKHSKITDWVDLADSFYNASIENNKVGIPIMWGTDAVHGHNNVMGATLFPHNIGLGAANNPNLIEKIGQATAKEVKATGIDWIFAPTVAVVRNDRWGRTYEGYSEDPEIVKAYAKSMIRGIQGNNDTFLNEDHLVGTIKHFIGDGGTINGKDQGNNISSERELLKIHSQGYLTALAAGAQTVMASFNSWNGVKVHGSHYLLTKVLKNDMGFDGFVIGDWNGHGQVVGCKNDSCAKAINAGVDMLMAPEDWKQLYYNTIEQVKTGQIKLARINDAVSRILRVKIRAGLFEIGKPSTRKHAGSKSIVGSTKHRDLARQAVRESLVLLKNKNNILPIKANSNVLITGSAADNIAQQSGGWSLTWQGTGNKNSDFPGATSISKGIADKIKRNGGKVQTSVDGTFIKRPDVAIVIFGEKPYAEGQGDRKDLYYSKDSKIDLELLKKFKENGIPTISIFITGRPLWVNPELNASDAFVVAWLPGTEGAGVADLLISGKVEFDFKGRLSFSWPAHANQTQVNRNDKNYAPLFPYNFGLSYKDYDSLGDSLSDIPYLSGNQFGSKFEINIFIGRTIAPYLSYVADSINSKLPLNGGIGVSSNKSVSVIAIDKDIQEDARQIHFKGKDISKYFFKSSSPNDFSKYLKKDGYLEFDLRKDNKIVKPMFVKFADSKINLSSHLSSLPLNKWRRIIVPLGCFDKSKTNFTNVTMPFGLETNSQLKVSLANIRIRTNSSAQKIVNCP
jgi:beta-glucosidase